MLKIVIFVVMVILMGTVALPLAANHMQASSRVAIQHNLNFSSYGAGAYPENLSWINFRNVNTSQYTRISVENSAYGKGLLVSTYGFNGLPPSFLDIGMGLYRNFTLKITFTWSTNNSLSQTGDRIMMKNGSTNLLQYNFGPYYNKSLYMKSRKDVRLGPEPQKSGLYTLQISSSTPTGTIYSGIARGYNATTHSPLMLNSSSFEGLKNCSLFFGGGFSRFTVYNIYLSSSIDGFNTLKYGDSVGYRDTNISSVYFSGLDFKQYPKPVVDWKDNSILYAGGVSGTALYSYNFHNNTQFKAMKLKDNLEFLASAGTGSDGYFLTGNRTGALLYVLNYTSGDIGSYPFNSTFKQGAGIYPSGNNVFMQSQNGSLTVLNLSSSYSTRSPWPNPGSVPLRSWAGLSGLITESYNNTTGILSVERADQRGLWQNLTSMSIRTVDFLPVISHGTLLGTNSGNYYSRGKNLSVSYVVAGKSYDPYVMGPNFTLEAGTGQHFIVKNGTGIYLQYKGYLDKTNIRRDFQFVKFNRNFSRGLSIDNRTITFYSTLNGQFSPHNVSLSAHIPNVFRGCSSIPYSVGSSVAYTVSAELGLKPLNASGGYVNFTTNGLESGKYVFTLKATNIAGYVSSISKTVSIDNYRPKLFSSPGNGSYVLSGSRIEFHVGNMTGNIETHLSGPIGISGVYYGSAFNITAPEESGPLNLSASVLDQFGLRHNFTFSYHVESFNSSEYMTNINPGSYLPSGNINLSWKGMPIATGYRITVFSAEYRMNISTLQNYTKLAIGSGYYSLYVNATGNNGGSIPLVNESFTVQDFNPSLVVRKSQGRYFSFYGNSPNSTLFIMARTNVSSRLWLNYTGPHSRRNLYSGKGSYFNFTIDRNIGFFKQNGQYSFLVTAKEKSGRSSSYHTLISVNNSIPTLLKGNRTFYYNSSYASLPLTLRDNTSYWYRTNNSASNTTFSQGSRIKLSDLSTRVILGARTLWGNENRSAVNLVYSDKAPRISLSVSPGILVWSNNVTIRYNVKDAVALTAVTLVTGNSTKPLGTTGNGTIHYGLDSDGSFNFYLKAADLCGNHNTSQPDAVKSDYYPRITSIVPGIAVFLGIAHLSSGIHGKDLESVNVTWSTGGSLIGSGNSIWMYILPGAHTYVLTLHYHSRTVSRTAHIFALGFLPELGAGIAMVSAALYRKYSGRPDSTRAHRLVVDNLGKTRREIYRIGRKSGIRAVTITGAIRELQESSRLVSMKDPDGTVYLMDPGSLDQ